MIQFPELLIIADTFGHLWFNACMRLAKAYRSLPRPYSALKPSHPLPGVTLPLTIPLNLLPNQVKQFCPIEV